MTELETFRAETRTWLEANVPQSIRNLPDTEDAACWGGRKWAFRDDDQRIWLERMVARGWTAPEWPVEYGGAGLSKDESKILQQELRRLRARNPLDSLGIWMLGPALLQFGTEAQKHEHLPKIARGEIRWAQGYSEPGAGSDLASVQTRGEDRGDHFLVNGSKIWTSYGDKADMIFALVRTEPDAPKHLGISFLLIDMADSGVSTKPIRLMAGDSPFTQTFFDDVKVPKANLVGERGRGWDVTKYLLGHEREMIGSSPMSSMGSETLAQRAVASMGKDGIARAGALRSDILQYELDAWTMVIALERNRDLAKARQAAPTSASALKLVGTELNKRRSELLMTVEGSDAFARHGAAASDWLHAPANTIAGGSSEIQLNILAKRALGLPEPDAMSLVLNDDEQMLVGSLRSLLARSAPIGAFRAMRDSGDPKRYAPTLWSELAESGFAAPQVPESEGGLGMGYTAAGLAAEEMGRVLAASPFLANALAIEILLAAGQGAHRDALLPGLLDGSKIAAVALDEAARHDPDHVATTVRRDGDGWRIDGVKRYVIDGGNADVLIVAAMIDAELALVTVERAAPGVTVTALDLIDSRSAADIAFDGTQVADDALLTRGAAAQAALSRALDVGRVLLSAELLGIGQEAFDRTVAYLKEREQFGVKIGSFQALQHRAARQHVALEFARGVVLKALRALDDRDPAATALASLAKAVTTRSMREVMNEAVQMHGGVGVTDEFDIGLFFKRVRVAGETLGDDYFHKERLARIAWHI